MHFVILHLFQGFRLISRFPLLTYFRFLFDFFLDTFIFGIDVIFSRVEDYEPHKVASSVFSAMSFLTARKHDALFRRSRFSTCRTRILDVPLTVSPKEANWILTTLHRF
jgi:hypothetical protein